MVIAASVATAVLVGLLVALLTKLRRPSGPAHRARKAVSVPGVDATPAQFWLTVLGAGLLTFVLFYAVTGLVVVSVVPAAVVATLPRAYFARKAATRQAAVQDSWPDGLRDMLTSIRSGASLARSVENLSMHGPAPLREAFQGFGVYARSLGVVAALEMVKEDLADPTSDRVIEVLVLAHERGGASVPSILQDLADAVSKDLWTMEQIRTESLEQKINSRVVFVLPWIVLIAMTARPGPFREFYGTNTGVAVVLLGGLLSLVGIFVASRLGSTPEEPRVFGGGG